ncbi:MAG TPA: hypothetical protein VKU88_05195 [Acidimicrobiales bacterium]|nr:hypothetical protein [Acidimicrobiales bacterium]
MPFDVPPMFGQLWVVPDPLLPELLEPPGVATADAWASRRG